MLNAIYKTQGGFLDARLHSLRTKRLSCGVTGASLLLSSRAVCWAHTAQSFLLCLYLSR
jgi:hypothetical protein